MHKSTSIQIIILYKTKVNFKNTFDEIKKEYFSIFEISLKFETNEPNTHILSFLEVKKDDFIDQI